ncbi:MAG: hemolysin III family protein [Pirellulaceae bacterium]|jgi:channel protein (hemolysin III family)|nr:hemolysin III family protein [Pirellulaceae bacterium]MDP7017555.1 hemolysin III family protein [Pirellulaceae bacterium]
MEEIITVYAIPGFREPVSCFSHLFAAPVFAALTFILIRRGRGCWLRVLSLWTMGLATVFLLAMSGVYHLLGPGTGRFVMRQLDIACVFVMIAGTITPIHMILFHGIRRWLPLLVVWTCAAVGITLRSTFPNGLPPGVGTGLFLLMGWGGLISCILLWRSFGFQFVKPLLFGGIAYTVGAIVLLADWPVLIPGVIGAHELWHVAVIAGLSLHWSFVFDFADGSPASSAENESSAGDAK